MSSPKRYINVKIPEELAEEVDNILTTRKLGYRSRAEFIVEATREKLVQIKATKEEAFWM